MNRGLLINCTHDYTLRLLPSFTITKAEVRYFLRTFESVLASNSVSQSTPVPPEKEKSPRLAQSATR
jgi:acetylornithine/succinyldiaminopimelate/putrescine aminotransferase